MSLPDLIIAGTPKCGTTSVFRYLCAHPAICGSSVKEIHFFNRHADPILPEILQDYEAFFRHCENRKLLRVEASPRYLAGGKRIAQRIKNYLPEVRLIFLLREPASRFLSRYFSLKSKTDTIPASVKLDEFVLLGLDGISRKNQSGTDIGRAAIRAREYIREGCYAESLFEYFEVFEKNRIFVGFFDHLKDNPLGFMRDVCRFCAVDEGFYEGFRFVVENRTRVVKYGRLNKQVEKVNRRMHVFLNRYPAMRNVIRRLYFGYVNPEVTGKDDERTQWSQAQLKRFYLGKNAELAHLLKERFPRLTLPTWLPVSDAAKGTSDGLG